MHKAHIKRDTADFPALITTGKFFPSITGVTEFRVFQAFAFRITFLSSAYSGTHEFSKALQGQVFLAIWVGSDPTFLVIPQLPGSSEGTLGSSTRP